MSPVLKWRSNWFKRFQSKGLTSSLFDVLKKQLCLCWQHKTIGWYRLAFKSCKIGYHYVITQNYWFEELGHTSVVGGTYWEKTGRSKTPQKHLSINHQTSCAFLAWASQLLFLSTCIPKLQATVWLMSNLQLYWIRRVKKSNWST